MQNNDMIVNVEVNSTKGRKIERKNNNYICQLILKQTKKSSDYKSKYKKVYQINLNTYGVTKDKRFIVHWREYFNSNCEDVTSYCKNIYNQPIIVSDYKSYPLSRYIHNYYNSNGNIIYSYINNRENDK